MLLAGAISSVGMLGVEAQVLAGNTSPIAFVTSNLADGTGRTLNANAITEQNGLGFAGQLITVNTGVGTFYGVGRNLTDRAVTVLHELGHAMFNLTGMGSILPDRNSPNQSQINSDVIREVCRF